MAISGSSFRPHPVYVCMRARDGLKTRNGDKRVPTHTSSRASAVARAMRSHCFRYRGPIYRRAWQLSRGEPAAEKRDGLPGRAFPRFA